jgi:hypothetical protein
LNPEEMEAFFQGERDRKPAEKLLKMGIYVIKASKSSCDCVDAGFQPFENIILTTRSVARWPGFASAPGTRGT